MSCIEASQLISLFLMFYVHSNQECEVNTRSVREIKDAVRFIESAIELQDQAVNDLSSLSGGKKSIHQDNINPNTNRYRILWQAAYATIIQKIRHEKFIRAKWAK